MWGGAGERMTGHRLLPASHSAMTYEQQPINQSMRHFTRNSLHAYLTHSPSLITQHSDKHNRAPTRHPSLKQSHTRSSPVHLQMTDDTDTQSNSFTRFPRLTCSALH